MAYVQVEAYNDETAELYCSRCHHVFAESPQWGGHDARLEATDLAKRLTEHECSDSDSRNPSLIAILRSGYGAGN